MFFKSEMMIKGSIFGQKIFHKNQIYENYIPSSSIKTIHKRGNTTRTEGCWLQYHVLRAYIFIVLLNTLLFRGVCLSVYHAMQIIFFPNVYSVQMLMLMGVKTLYLVQQTGAQNLTDKNTKNTNMINMLYGLWIVI